MSEAAGPPGNESGPRVDVSLSAGVDRSALAVTCDNLSCQECHPPERSCDKCGQVIPYMESGRGNLDGGMRLYFQGWYGGTIDPFYEPRVLLCDACATTFLRENAWLAEADRELRVPPLLALTVDESLWDS